MKTLKTKFFALAFFALGFTALTTSCGKEGEEDGGNYTSENVAGEYVGVHKLDIPTEILKVLSDNLPPDSNGVKPDLTQGFEDTLTVSVSGNIVTVTSALLDQTVEGKLTGNNQVKIDEKKFPVLNLGTAVTAENASVSTARDVRFSAGSTPTNVELRLKATKIASLSLNLDIKTNGSFVRQ